MTGSKRTGTYPLRRAWHKATFRPAGCRRALRSSTFIHEGQEPEGRKGSRRSGGVQVRKNLSPRVAVTQETITQMPAARNSPTTSPKKKCLARR